MPSASRASLLLAITRLTMEGCSSKRTVERRSRQRCRSLDSKADEFVDRFEATFVSPSFLPVRRSLFHDGSSSGERGERGDCFTTLRW
jgi:hypothetical protein